MFANVGKAIAAYEKSLRHAPSRLDGYIDAVLRGDRAAGSLLRADEARGPRLFIGKGQCVSCHNGPLFSDQQFHNTGVPPRDAARPDRGRAAATAVVRADEFNCLGPFSDARPEQCQELRFMVSDDTALEGGFKTPGLRGVADRPPYMHAGQFATLEQVVRHYVKAPHAAVGHSELTHRHAVAATPRHTERAPIELNDAEVADLVSFLGALTAERSAGSRDYIAATITGSRRSLAASTSFQAASSPAKYAFASTASPPQAANSAAAACPNQPLPAGSCLWPLK